MIMKLSDILEEVIEAFKKEGFEKEIYKDIKLGQAYQDGFEDGAFMALLKIKEELKKKEEDAA